jgi:hypothetical protein
MYCSGCGQPIASNQPTCAQCGRPAYQPAPAGFSQAAYPPTGAAYANFAPYNRVHRHIQTLGILWLAYSLLAVLAFLVAIPFITHIFGHQIIQNFGHQNFPFPISMTWILPLITIFIYLRAALGALVGIALLRRERWGRILALVVGVLTLIKFPLGTALGIYTLWVLVPNQSAQEYDQIAAP